MDGAMASTRGVEVQVCMVAGEVTACTLVWLIMVVILGAHLQAKAVHMVVEDQLLQRIKTLVI